MKHLFQKVDTFSIRKLSIGACSIIVGTMFLGSSVAHADATDTTLFLSGSDSYVLTEETNQDGQNLSPLVPLLSEEAPVTESSEALLVGSAPASETAEIPLGENQETDKESLLSPSLEIEVDKVEVADVIGENVEQLPPSRLETEENDVSDNISDKELLSANSSSLTRELSDISVSFRSTVVAPNRATTVRSTSINNSLYS